MRAPGLTCALLQAKRSTHDAVKSCEAELRAKEAAAAAETASEAAAASAAVATASAERAAQTVATAQAKLNGPIEELADSAALLESENTEAEGSTQVDTEAEAAAAEASKVQVAELDTKAATRMHSIWEAIEQGYVRGAKIVFSGLRRLRQSCEQRFIDAQNTFASHLMRADERQMEVTKFQTQYNEIDLDMMKVPEVQAELALQVSFPNSTSCWGEHKVPPAGPLKLAAFGIRR